MSEQSAVETQETQPVADAVPDSAGLEAGFRKARGERAEPEAEPPAKAEAQPAQAAQPEQPAATEQQQQPVEELPEWAKREFNRLNGELQKVYGKFGHVERRLQQPPQNAQVKPLAITPAALKRVKETFGDEFAEAIAGDLSEVYAAPAVEKPPEPAVQQEEKFKAEQEETLTLLVPEWRELRTHPKFSEWFGTKPEQYQSALGKSFNANAVAAGLNDFKSWLGSQQQSREQTAQTNQQRLARAVQPRTTATPARLALPDEKGLEIGFAKARGLRPQP